MSQRFTVLLALSLVAVGASPAASAASDWPDPSEADIRPGVTIDGSTCTANFVFSATDGDELYIGSAAHCFEGLPVGTNVSIAGIEDAGELAYCGFGPPGDAGCPPPDCDTFVVVAICSGAGGVDAALVEIRPEHQDEVHPAMLEYGGPDGVDEDVQVGEKVLTFGNSALREGAEERLDAREGYVTESQEGEFRAYFAGPGVPGDSGSPVVTADGGAGILITLGIVPPGDNGVVPLDHAIERFDKADAVDVELEPWSTTANGTLPAVPS